ncbi:MAG: serine protease [Actinomycetota bacterium]
MPASTNIRNAAKPTSSSTKTAAKSKSPSTTTSEPPSRSASSTSGSSGGGAAGRRKRAADTGSGTTAGTATVRGESATSIAEAERSGRRVTVSASKLAGGRVTGATTSDAEAEADGVVAGLQSRLLARTPFRSRRRVGGVAPFVPPRSRLGRRLRMREWSRVGFVQLSPGKQKLRHRILPRTVIGIAGLLMAAGVGAAFSGAAFYAYYSNRLAENERTVSRFIDGFDQQFTDAAGALDEMRTEAVGTIRTELEPLESYVADARGIVELPVTAGPSVWLVETRDEAGAVTHGSAFAIVGHNGGTALITSHSVVRASTTEPGPTIELLKDGRRIPATLWSWDASTDLALLVVDEQLPVLAMANETTQVRSVGGPVFALSGFGGQGATASPGHLIDHSQVGLQHTAPVGTLYAGGPLLDSAGNVLGMASSVYQPLGISPGDVPQAPDVAAFCRTVLRCSENDLSVTAQVATG